MHFKTLNNLIRNSKDAEVTIDNCIGQRFIGDGLRGKTITINGTPGNALGAYLDGARIVVNGNAQDATGDTMNDGDIFIHGSSGDATGYAMRGGRIYVKGDAGYRAGIHMKAYREKLPVLVIGGAAGSFLGEYQAGGIIIVLGLGCESEIPVGYFCGTGMHGGKIYLRCDKLPHDPVSYTHLDVYKRQVLHFLYNNSNEQRRSRIGTTCILSLIHISISAAVDRMNFIGNPSHF